MQKYTKYFLIAATIGTMPVVAMDNNKPQQELQSATVQSMVPSLKFLAANKVKQMYAESEDVISFGGRESKIEGLNISKELKDYIKLMEYDAAGMPRASSILTNAASWGGLNEQLFNDLRAINPNISLNDALQYAAAWGNASSVDFLIKHGANVNYQWNGQRSPLIVILENQKLTPGHIETLKVLLQAGADVNLANDGGDTTLLEAACNGHAQVIPDLIAHGALLDHQNERGNTALMEAILQAKRNPESINIVKILLSHKPNLELVASYGNTAFRMAVTEKNEEIIKLLKKAGANINHPSPILLYTPLMSAVINDDYNLAALLLELGANTEIVDSSNETALMKAVKNEKQEMVKLLLSYGADANAETHFGTPIMFALEKRNFEMAHMLLGTVDYLLVTRPHKYSVGLRELVKTENTQLLEKLFDKGLNKSFDLGPSYKKFLIEEACPSMATLLRDYRDPEYQQLPWYKRLQFETKQWISHHPRATIVGASIGMGLVSTAAWYWMKRK